MIAYLDSSVLLRWVLRQPDRLREVARIEKPVSSKLVRVELHRTLDRLWHSGELDDEQLRNARRAAETFLEVITLQELDDDVIDFASQPLPTILGATEAVHLGTAMRYGGADWLTGFGIYFATHDPVLAAAARTMRFQVLGA